MKQLREIAKEEANMKTIAGLTSAFEGLASMRIAQIKNQVLESQKFFDELWQMYTQMRVDSLFRFGREEDVKTSSKELFIIITAEGGFSGDIDQKLTAWMLKQYDPAKQDIIVIGHHGAVQLMQVGVKFVKYYKLPTKDQNINVTPLVRYISQYRTTSVFYQAYVSLMVQEVRKIELQKAVQAAGAKIEKDEEIISEVNYIFEPSSFDVVSHLERSMLKISLSQLILDSKLAQYASRFRSMSVSKQRAIEGEHQLRLQYSRTKRSISDERLKEVMNGLRKGATA
jgi:ATP synthase F1 gamma subunit